MATVSCRCCLIEISADRDLCYRCGDTLGGSFRIEYPMTDFDRKRIPATCTHRQAEREGE